jgi:hypothetical protein
VTGDKPHLLAIELYDGIKIVSVRDFITLNTAVAISMPWPCVRRDQPWPNEPKTRPKPSMPKTGY